MPSPSDSARVHKTKEKYSVGLVSRDNDLKNYNYFLSTLGETHTLEEIIDTYAAKQKLVRVLDLGCGNAQALHELKEKMGKKVRTIGMDLLPLETKKLDEFVEGDAIVKELPKDCDVIISFRALHDMGHIAEVLSKVAYALRTKGKAYLWIRLKEDNDPAKFTGEMSFKDQVFLNDLCGKSLFQTCKVHAKKVPDTNPPQGYAIVLERLS